MTSPFLEKLSKVSESDLPRTVQEQKERIMKTLEKCFTDYLLEHPDELDKLAEMKSNTHRPLEILSLFTFNQSSPHYA